MSVAMAWQDLHKEWVVEATELMENLTFKERENIHFSFKDF